MDFLKNCKFHHVGMAVKKITDYVKDKDIITDARNGVRLAFADMADTRIELVEPWGNDSPISDLTEKSGGIYHLAFSSPDINATIKDAKKNDFVQVHPPQKAKAFGDRNIVWLFHDRFGLIEIIESR